MSRKDRGKLPPFVALFRHTLKSPTWKALSVGARATFFALKINYNSNAQNAVFLSARDGAKELGACKDTVCKWLHELEHYGFIVEVQGAHLGVTGVGKATLYRLTDCGYAGKPPTYEFQNWDGVLFDPEKQNPVRKIRTPRPVSSDIRAKKQMAQNMEHRPNPSDIRNDKQCPVSSDITSFTRSRPNSEQPVGADLAPPTGLSVWSSAVVEEVFGEEAAWLRMICEEVSPSIQPA